MNKDLTKLFVSSKCRLLLLLLICSAIFFSSCSEEVVSPSYVSKSPPASSYDGTYAMEWNALLYRVIANESRLNPPKASRVYAYTCITIYESVVSGMYMNRSLSGQLKDMPQMPQSDINFEYDWPSVITGSAPVVMRGLLNTDYGTSLNMINNLYNRQVAERKVLKDSNVINRSLSYGVSIANRILQWANSDRYLETRGLPYTPPPRSLNPANWEPINPGDTAEEPYWGTLRPYAVPTSAFCEIPPSYFFDTVETSPFYRDELEIKTIKDNMTPEQEEIALFWRDKQLTGTPPGHWVYIMCQMVTQLNLRLDRAAEMFALGGIALGDAFITSWYVKYKYNYLRPQSYIRDYIDPGFLPLIPTPPFPDYPSGHSTGSGACAYILTQLLGQVSFTDTTHLRMGMAGRYFNSFNEAAVECSVSRIYGGIHYRNACENGVLTGKKIGETIMQRIHLKLF